MKKRIVTVTLWCVLWSQLAAHADPHDEGLAAGAAANPVIRGTVNQPSAASVVPGYTATPPETAYAGQPNLTPQVNAHLSACATTPNDPVCQAQLGALASASTPRPTVTASDPNVAQASAIARNPSLALGSLAAYYAGCITNDVAPTATGSPVPAQATASNCPNDVFCLGTNCFSKTYTNDADFARAMSFLEAAREAGIYLDPDRMQVFTGEQNNCRDRLSKNCCYADAAGAGMSNQSLFGIGSRFVYDVLMNADNRTFLYQGLQALLVSGGFEGSFTSYGVTVAVNGTALPAGSVTLTSTDSLVVAFDPWSLAIAVVIYIVVSMTSCNEDEGKLAMKEGAHLCHAVGTWCSSCLTILGKCVSCIERTTSKCCFNSVLSRLINEQGRTQLGKPWGDAEHPDCSGFTIAQLQSLDFAAMDLTEFYAAIVPNLPNVGNLQSTDAGRLSNCYYGQGKCQ